MEIKQAEFVSSETDVKKCPPALKPEFAFIGRSNVGKSSLLNALAGRPVATAESCSGRRLGAAGCP